MLSHDAMLLPIVRSMLSQWLFSTFQAVVHGDSILVFVSEEGKNLWFVHALADQDSEHRVVVSGVAPCRRHRTGD